MKRYVVDTHCEDICCEYLLRKHMLWVLIMKTYFVGTHCEDIVCGYSL